ncbi:MAG: ArsA-related P-loop ATPase [Actinomycetota bacterium]
MTALDLPVLVFLGGGGVGKTTLAACAGIAAAQRGERAVVLTIDPARRLASTLGLDGAGDGGPADAVDLGNEPVLVEGPWPGELWAAMLDPAATLDTALRRHGGDDQAERIQTNPLFGTIVNTLSGSNEYLAAERLHQLHHDERFDRVVIDTPPARHAIDFLDSPDRLSRFLNNRLYRLVLAPRQGLLRPVTSAAQLVMRTAAKLVGADLVENVIALFADLDGVEDGFRTRAEETAELLAGADCGYVIVTSPRAEPIAEATWILDRLVGRERSATAVVVNRLLPFGRQQPSAVPAGVDYQRAKALVANWEELAVLSSMEDEVVDALIAELGDDAPTLITVTERLIPATSVDDLAELATDLDGGHDPDG